MKIEYSAEYVTYIKSGESAAVFIARDICKSIDTSGCWIDILDMKKKNNFDDKWDFEWIDIELFPRKIKPNYTNNMSDNFIKYITWQTAMKDIEKQRKNGFIGNRYRIFPKLYNKNEGRTRGRYGLWNKTFNRFVPEHWKTSSCEYRTVQVPMRPNWKYTIISVKKL